MRTTTGQAAEVLAAAIERISDSAHWTTGAEARTALGEPCHPCAEAAVQWCAVGALQREAVDLALSTSAFADVIEEASHAVHSL